MGRKGGRLKKKGRRIGGEERGHEDIFKKHALPIAAGDSEVEIKGEEVERGGEQ